MCGISSVAVFATKSFRRFQRKERISNAALLDAFDRAQRGLVDADLGGALIKQRVARPGGGKSGGYRTIIAYRSAERAIFLFGFPKNAKSNLSPKELEHWQLIASDLLGAVDAAIQAAIADDELTEVANE